jgi:hypothetical protein
MTTKEIAVLTGLNNKTILRVIDKLFPDMIKNGKRTILNKEQARLVVSELRKKGFISEPRNLCEVGDIPSQNVKVDNEPSQNVKVDNEPGQNVKVDNEPSGKSLSQNVPVATKSKNYLQVLNQHTIALNRHSDLTSRNNDLMDRNNNLMEKLLILPEPVKQEQPKQLPDKTKRKKERATIIYEVGDEWCVRYKQGYYYIRDRHDNCKWYLYFTHIKLMRNSPFDSPKKAIRWLEENY